MRILNALIVVAVLPTALGACGIDGGIGNPSSGSGGPVSIGTTSTAQFGAILVGTHGMPLYTKAGDSATTSTCTGACEAAWPPLTVSKGQQAVGGPGVNGAFATFTRPDGTLQATYKDLPLYYSQGDKSPGDVTGNGVEGFSVAAP